MPRFVAFLRGVSPMNAKMADLKACLERLGFTRVKTVRSSGNVVFTADQVDTNNLSQLIEAGMRKDLPRSFSVFVRSTDHLHALLAADPFDDFQLSPKAKRVVAFLGHAQTEEISLPIEFEGAKILCVEEGEAFMSYVPQDSGPSFMRLIEKMFGKNITTRTWDTIKKCAEA